VGPCGLLPPGYPPALLLPIHGSELSKDCRPGNACSRIVHCCGGLHATELLARQKWSPGLVSPAHSLIEVIALFAGRLLSSGEMGSSTRHALVRANRQQRCLNSFERDRVCFTLGGSPECQRLQPSR